MSDVRGRRRGRGKGREEEGSFCRVFFFLLLRTKVVDNREQVRGLTEDPGAVEEKEMREGGDHGNAHNLNTTADECRKNFILL